MTVYVDTMKAPFGRMIMCHCWADTREELFAMMDKIGVQRKWFQQPPKASWEHFDISQSKRALAVKFGAVETDKYGPTEWESTRKFLDPNTPYDQRVRALTMLSRVGTCRRLPR